MLTPLIALGRQQIQRFQELQVPVWSGVGDPSQVQIPDSNSGVLVLSPERLRYWEKKLDQEFRPNFLIVDEAHCVFEWGENFRPAFLDVAPWVRSRLKGLKTFWCSATLRPPMIQQLQDLCGPHTQVLGQFQVPQNIQIQKLKMSGAEKLQWVERFLSCEGRALSGLIVVSTRNLAERLAQYLAHHPRPILVYHAGMGAEERRALEKKIEGFHLSGQVFLVIATSAFGMGMDYPALRFGVLFDPPYTVLQLAQSLGRVGRAGRPAWVFALWCIQDLFRLKQITQHHAVAHEEALRLESWYHHQGSPVTALENDFRQSDSSGKMKDTDVSELAPHHPT